MKKRNVFLLLFAVLVPVAGLFPVHVLQIEDPRKERVVFVRSLQPDDRFSLRYRHSVELCRVWDYFRIDGQYRLVLDETVFGSSNAGLPSVLGDGERFTRGTTASRISNMRRTLPAVEIWVNRRYENTLEFGGRKIRLPELAGDTLLRLSIRKVILFEFLYEKMHSLMNRMNEEMR
ncbi:MAG: DUF1850 domain-containing protein [Deltaproteobacteria bacterium]|nr:DUF1850 domain-containing protein [Deltaproteobacteria bacterium]